MPEALKRLIWPVAALVLLLLVNAAVNPKFFHLAFADGRMSGSIVDVFRLSAPIMLTALGMTLVIATGGIDLSVGALMAVAGSLAAVLLVNVSASLAASGSLVAQWLIILQAPLIVAILVPLSVCMAAGLWNGMLVAFVRVQPIVATLVLMVAGRGIAQLLTDGQSIEVKGNSGFAFLGLGTRLGVPMPVWIAALLALAIAALVRLTALGLFIESIGGNETASRFAGINVRTIRLAVYALSGLCAGVAGLIYTSNITTSDANNAGLYMELDAILAVVIGGTALTGGRFSIVGSLLGALIIQTLTTTILMTQFGGNSIPPEYNLVAKAAIVLVVCLLQSEVLQRLVFSRRGTA